jgi:hypothetical protein
MFRSPLVRRQVDERGREISSIFTSMPLNHFDLRQVGKFPGGTGVEVKSVASASRRYAGITSREISRNESALSERRATIGLSVFLSSPSLTFPAASYCRRTYPQAN